MKTILFILVIIAVIACIASGVWVAIALGNAISNKNKKKEISRETMEKS